MDYYKSERYMNRKTWTANVSDNTIRSHACHVEPTLDIKLIINGTISYHSGLKIHHFAPTSLPRDENSLDCCICPCFYVVPKCQSVRQWSVSELHPLHFDSGIIDILHYMIGLFR